MIGRTDTTGIRYVFVSQDPALYWVKSKDDGGLALTSGDEISERFIKACKGEKTDDGRVIKRGVFEYAGKLLDRTHFNPAGDDVYWSHVLRCPPKESNGEIRKDWKGAKKYCPGFLESELKAIESKRFCVVSIGRRSLRVCSKILDIPLKGRRKSLKKEGISVEGNGITHWHRYQIEHQDSLGTSRRFEGKEITLFGFTHSSRANTSGKDLVADIMNGPGGLLKRLYH